MDSLFKVHRLDEEGLKQAAAIAVAFDNLLLELNQRCPMSREFSTAKTHLETACFYAKKSVAAKPENQEPIPCCFGISERVKNGL